MNIPKEYSNLSGPYVNIALSMDNMVQLFEVPHAWTYGLLTLRPLWTITGIKSLWLPDVKLPFEWSIGFNTATYLFPFYYDFGYAGLVVFPFLLGVICGALYRRVCLFRPLSILAYSFIVSGICLSFMDNLFVFIPFWVDIVLISAIIKFAEAPEGRVQLEPLGRARGGRPVRWLRRPSPF
jgi:oligosaccharide repeat unit polymerase